MVSITGRNCHPRRACRQARLRGDPMLYFIFFLLFSFSSFAEEVTPTQHFQGQAKIENNDHVQARKLAIEAGLKNLLVDYLKTNLGDKYFRIQEALESKILKTPLKYVRKYSVYDGKVEGENYVVSVSGFVHEKLIEEDVALVALAPGREARSKVLIMVAEKYIKDPMIRYWWNEGKVLPLENTVNESVFEVHGIFYSTLQKSGYDVIDISAPTNQHQIPPECQTLDLSGSVLTRMAELYDVDYILYGKAFSEMAENKKVKTSIQLAFYNNSLKKDILVISDAYEADLIQEFISGIADSFMKKLRLSLLTKSSSQGVIIVVKHNQNFRKFKEIKEILERASTAMIMQSAKQGENVFLLKTSQSVGELKESIKREIHTPTMHIHERDGGEILEIEIINDNT